MQQLLTGKRRFPEFAKSDWTEYHLGELFSERKETNRTDLPLLAITSDRGVIPRDEVDRKDASSEDKSKYKRISPGDIGYNTMRMWQGVSALSSLEGIVSPAYTICKPKKNIDSQFAAYLFKYPPVVNIFYRYSQGLVSDTLNLKFPNFSQIKVTIPQPNEQKRIASMLATYDREISLLQAQAEALKRHKRGLMQKLLTGQIRVKGV
jgi:type I restriction enzyme S subunit